MPACLQRTAAEGEYPFVRVDGLLLVAGTMTVLCRVRCWLYRIRSDGYREICYVGRKRFGRRGAFESAFAQVLQVARDSRRSSFGAGESGWD